LATTLGSMISPLYDLLLDAIQRDDEVPGSQVGLKSRKNPRNPGVG
jgi:hypothetical protein